ncbi:MAG: T9SS type A sorting domain-containing protein [Bacteroidales bacterium]|nr:T9SS type A sorting domain-containing protein [Bacteroidales bacterium]
MKNQLLQFIIIAILVFSLTKIASAQYIPVSQQSDGSWVFTMPNCDVEVEVELLDISIDSLSPTEYVYNGVEIKPAITATAGTINIPANKCIAKYPDEVINVGTKSISEVKVWNNGGGYATIITPNLSYTITPLVISPTDPNLSITLNPSSFTYNGSPKEPAVTVTYNGTEIPSSEYTVNYKNNINAGTATAEIVDIQGGNYTVNGSKDFTINPYVITPTDPNLSITLTPDSYIYDGSPKEPAVTVTYNDTEIPSSEYTVNYKNNINAGTATAEIIDNQGGNYTINGSKDFIIDPYVISPNDPNLSITLTPDTYIYNGSPNEPAVNIVYNGIEIPASEYTVSYENNINVGTATAIITDNPNGNYTINGSKEFTITPLEIDLNDPNIASLLSIVLNPDSYIYDGTPKEPAVTITFNGLEVPAAEYTVSYQDNINAGTAKAIITDNQGGNYTINGETPFIINPFVITPNDPNLLIILENDTYQYTGSPIEPKVTITYSGTTIPPAEYTVSYQNNINVGTATVLITDNPNGNYTINGSTTFIIKPGKIYITPSNTDPDGAILADASNQYFCSGKAIIDFTAQNGTLDYFSLEFDDNKIPSQNGSISGNRVEIALPKDLLPGTYNGTLEMTTFDGNFTGKLPIRVNINLPFYSIVTLYNDVAAVNQLAGDFTNYIWKENNIEISGANSRLLQYRFEKKSVYTAILTKTNGNSYETCPLDLSRITESTNTEVNVYPNPGNSLSDVFVEITHNYQPDANSHIYIYNLNGRLAKQINNPQEKNTIQLPTGNYSGVYIQNGEKVPFKLIVK